MLDPTAEPPDIKTGDKVWLVCDNRHVEAEVVIASRNRISLIVRFEAILLGHVGMMPLLWENGAYHCVFGGENVGVHHVRPS